MSKSYYFLKNIVSNGLEENPFLSSWDFLECWIFQNEWILILLIISLVVIFEILLIKLCTALKKKPVPQGNSTLDSQKNEDSFLEGVRFALENLSSSNSSSQQRFNIFSERITPTLTSQELSCENSWESTHFSEYQESYVCESSTPSSGETTSSLSFVHSEVKEIFITHKKHSENEYKMIQLSTKSLYSIMKTNRKKKTGVPPDFDNSNTSTFTAESECFNKAPCPPAHLILSRNQIQFLEDYVRNQIPSRSKARLKRKDNGLCPRAQESPVQNQHPEELVVSNQVQDSVLEQSTLQSRFAGQPQQPSHHVNSDRSQPAVKATYFAKPPYLKEDCFSYLTQDSFQTQNLKRHQQFLKAPDIIDTVPKGQQQMISFTLNHDSVCSTMPPSPALEGRRSRRKIPGGERKLRPKVPSLKAKRAPTSRIFSMTACHSSKCKMALGHKNNIRKKNSHENKLLGPTSESMQKLVPSPKIKSSTEMKTCKDLQNMENGEELIVSAPNMQSVENGEEPAISTPNMQRCIPKEIQKNSKDCLDIFLQFSGVNLLISLASQKREDSDELEGIKVQVSTESVSLEEKSLVPNMIEYLDQSEKEEVVCNTRSDVKNMDQDKGTYDTFYNATYTIVSEPRHIEMPIKLKANTDMSAIASCILALKQEKLLDEKMTPEVKHVIKSSILKELQEYVRKDSGQQEGDFRVRMCPKPQAEHVRSEMKAITAESRKAESEQDMQPQSVWGSSPRLMGDPVHTEKMKQNTHSATDGQSTTDHMSSLTMPETLSINEYLIGTTVYVDPFGRDPGKTAYDHIAEEKGDLQRDVPEAEVGSFKIRKKMSGRKNVLGVKHVITEVKKPLASLILCVNRHDTPGPRKRLGGGVEGILKEVLHGEMPPPVLPRARSCVSSLPDTKMHSKLNAKKSSHIELTQEKSQVEREEKKLNSLGKEHESQNTVGAKLHDDVPVVDQALCKPVPFGKRDFRLDAHPGQGLNTEEELNQPSSFTATTRESADSLGVNPSHVANMKRSTPAQAGLQCSADWEMSAPTSGESLMGDIPRHGSVPSSRNDARKICDGFTEKGTGLLKDSPAALPETSNYCRTDFPCCEEKKRKDMTKTVNRKSGKARVKLSLSQTFRTAGNRKKSELDFKTKLKKINQAKAFVPGCLDTPYSFSHDHLRRGQPASEKHMDIVARSSAFYNREGKLPEAEQQVSPQAAPQHSQCLRSDAYQMKEPGFEEPSLSCLTQEQPANGQVAPQQKGFPHTAFSLKLHHVEVKESQKITHTESDMEFLVSAEIVPVKAENVSHKETMATTEAFGRNSDRELGLYPVETHSEIPNDLLVTFLKSLDSVIMPFVSKFKRQRKTLRSRKQAPVSHRCRTMGDIKPCPSQMASCRHNKRRQCTRNGKVLQQREHEADTALEVSHSTGDFLPDVNGSAYHKKDHDLTNSEEELSQSEITSTQAQADLTETSLCSTPCPILDQSQVEKLDHCFCLSPVTSGETKEGAFSTREDSVLADERHHKGQAAGGEKEQTVALYQSVLSISEKEKNKQSSVRKASVNLKYGITKTKKPSISCMANFKGSTNLNHTKKTQHSSLTTITLNIGMDSKTKIENGPSGETALSSTQARQEMSQHEGDTTLDDTKETDLHNDDEEEGDEEFFEVTPQCSQHFIFCSAPESDPNGGKLESKRTKRFLFIMEQDVPQQSELEDPVKGERPKKSLHTPKGTLCPAGPKHPPQASGTAGAMPQIAQHGVPADGSHTGVLNIWEKKEKAGFRNDLQVTVADSPNLSTSILPESKKEKNISTCRALQGKTSPIHVLMKGKEPSVSKTFNLPQSGCQRNLLPKILKSQITGLLCSGALADRLLMSMSDGPMAENDRGPAQELPPTTLGSLDFSKFASSTSNTQRENLQFMDKGCKMSPKCSAFKAKISPISQTLKLTDCGTAGHKKQLKCNSQTKIKQDKPVPNAFLNAMSSPMPMSLDLNTCNRGKKADALWEMRFGYEPKEQQVQAHAERAWCVHSIDKEGVSHGTEGGTGQCEEGGLPTSQCFRFSAPKMMGPTFVKSDLELKNSTTHPELEKSDHDRKSQEANMDRVQGRSGNAMKTDMPHQKEKMTPDTSCKPATPCGQCLCFCAHQMNDLGVHQSASDPKTSKGRNLSCTGQEMKQQTQLREILELTSRQVINFLQDEMPEKNPPIQETDNVVCQKTLSPKAGQSVIGSIPSDMPCDGNPKREWNCPISEQKAWNQNDLQTALKPLDFSSLPSPEYERGNTFSNRMLQGPEGGPLTEKAELQENLATTSMGPFDLFVPVSSNSQSHVSTVQSSEIEMISNPKCLTVKKKKPPISQILKINGHFNVKHRKKFQSNLRIKIKAMWNGDSVADIVPRTTYFISDTSNIKRQNEVKEEIALGASRFSHMQPTQVQLPVESKSAPMDKGGSDFLKRAELPAGQCREAKQELLIKTCPFNRKIIAVNENLKRKPNPTKSEGLLSGDSSLHRSQIYETNPEVDVKTGKTNSMQVCLKGGLSDVEKPCFCVGLSESTGNIDNSDKKKTFHVLKENSSCKLAGIGGHLPVSEETERQTDCLKAPDMSDPKGPLSPSQSASSPPLDGADHSAASIRENPSSGAPKVKEDTDKSNAAINSSCTAAPVLSQTKLEQLHSMWATYEESSEKRKFLKAREKEKFQQKVLLSKASQTIQPFEFGADQMRQPSPFQSEVPNTMSPESIVTPQKTAVYLVDQEGSIKLGEDFNTKPVLSSEAHPLENLNSELKATSREITNPKSFALPKKQEEPDIAGTTWNSSHANEPTHAEIIRQKDTAKTADVKSTTCTSQINLKAKQTSASQLHGYDNGGNKKELKETIHQQKICQLAEYIANLAPPVKKVPEVKAEDKLQEKKHVLEKSLHESQMSWPGRVDVPSTSDKVGANTSDQEHAHQSLVRDIPPHCMQPSWVRSQQVKKHSAVKLEGLQRKVSCDPVSQKNETDYLGLDILRCRRGTEMNGDQQDALPEQSSQKTALWEPEITGLESVPFPITEPPCLTKTKEPITQRDLKPPVLQRQKGLEVPKTPSDSEEQILTPTLMAQQSNSLTEVLLRSVSSHILQHCHPEKLKDETEIKDTILKDSTQQEKKISKIDLMTTHTERLLLLIKEQEKRRKTMRKNTKSEIAVNMKTRVDPNQVLTYSPTGVQSVNTTENSGICEPKDGTKLNKSIATPWGQQRPYGQGLSPDSVYIGVFASPEVISHKDKRGTVLVKSALYLKTLRMKVTRTPVFQLLQMTAYGSRRNRIDLRCNIQKQKALQQGRTGSHLVPNASHDSGSILFQIKERMETKRDEAKPQNPIQQLELKMSLDKREPSSQSTAEDALSSTTRKPAQCITEPEEHEVVLLNILPQHRHQLMTSQKVEEPDHINLNNNLERKAYPVIFPEKKEINYRRLNTPKPTLDTELKFLIAQRVKQGVVHIITHAISLPQGTAESKKKDNSSSSKGQNKILTELEASQQAAHKEGELPKQESTSMADLGSTACPLKEPFHLQTPGEEAKGRSVYINGRNIPCILEREEFKKTDALLSSKAQKNLGDLPKICASPTGHAKSGHLSRTILKSAPCHRRAPLHVKQTVNRMRRESDGTPGSVHRVPRRIEQPGLTDIQFKSNRKKVEPSELSRVKQPSNDNQNREKIMEPIFSCILHQLHEANTKNQILEKATLNSKVLNPSVKKLDVHIDQPLCMKGTDLLVRGRKYQKRTDGTSATPSWTNTHRLMSPQGKKASEAEDNLGHHMANTEKWEKKQKCTDKVLPKPESPIRTDLHRTNAQEQQVKLDAENMRQIRKVLEQMDVADEFFQSRKKGQKQHHLSTSYESFGKHVSGSQYYPCLQPHVQPHGEETLSGAGNVLKRTKELDLSYKAQLRHAQQYGLECVVPLTIPNQLKTQKLILPLESESSNETIKHLNVLSPQRKQSSNAVQVVKSTSKLGVGKKEVHKASQKEPAEVCLQRILSHSLSTCTHLLNKTKMQKGGIKPGVMKDITCPERPVEKLPFPVLFSTTALDTPSHRRERQWEKEKKMTHMKRRKEEANSAIAEEVDIISALPYFRMDNGIDGVIPSHVRRPRAAQEEEECRKVVEGMMDSAVTLGTEKSPLSPVLSKEELPLRLCVIEQQSTGQDSAGKSDMKVTTSGISLPCLSQLNLNSRIKEGRKKSEILKNCLPPSLKPQQSSQVRKVSFSESCHLNSATDTKCLAHEKRQCGHRAVDLNDIVGLICAALKLEECSIKYLQHGKEPQWNKRNKKQEKVIQGNKRNLDLAHSKCPGSILRSPRMEWDPKIKETYTQGIARFCLPSPTLRELSGTLGMEEESTDDILSSIKNAKYQPLRDRWETASEEIKHSKRIALREKQSSVLQELEVNVEEKEKKIQENGVEKHSKSCMTSLPNSEVDIRINGKEDMEIKTKFPCQQSQVQDLPDRETAYKKSTSLPILNNVKDSMQNVIQIRDESTKVEKDVPVKEKVSSLSHEIQLDIRDQKKTQQKSRDEPNMVVTNTSTYSLSHLKLDTKIEKEDNVIIISSRYSLLELPCQKSDELEESKELVDSDITSVSHREKAHLPQREEDEAEILAEKILHTKNEDWQESKAPSQVLLQSPKGEGAKKEQKKASTKGRNQEKTNDVDDEKVDIAEHEPRKMDAEGKQQGKINIKRQEEENMDVEVERQDIGNQEGIGQGKAEGESQRQEEIGPESKEQKEEQGRLDPEYRQQGVTGREVKEKEEMGPDRGHQERKVKEEEEEMGPDDRQEGKERELEEEDIQPDGRQQGKAEVKEEEEMEPDGRQEEKAGKVREQEKMEGEGRLQGKEVEEQWKMAPEGGLPGGARGKGLEQEKLGTEYTEREIRLCEGEDQGKVNRNSRNQGKTDHEYKHERSVLYVYISAPSSHHSLDTVEGEGVKGITQSPISLLQSQELSDAGVIAQIESLGDGKSKEVHPVQEYKAQNGVARGEMVTMKHTMHPKGMTSKTNTNQNLSQVLGQVLERQGKLGEVPIEVSLLPSTLDNGKVQDDPPGATESYLSPSQNMESSGAEKLKYTMSRSSVISRDSNVARSTTHVEEDKEAAFEKSTTHSKEVAVEVKPSLSHMPQTKQLPVDVSEQSKERQEGGEEMVEFLSKTRLFVTSCVVSRLDMTREGKGEAGTTQSHVPYPTLQESSSAGLTTVASTQSTVNRVERETQHPLTEDDEVQALATDEAPHPSGPGLQAKTYELPGLLGTNESSTLNTSNVPQWSHKDKAGQKQEGTRYPNVVLTKMNHVTPSPSLHRLSLQDKLSLSSRTGKVGYVVSNEDITPHSGVVIASHQGLCEETKDSIKRKAVEDGGLKATSLKMRISPPAHLYDRKIQCLSIKEQREEVKGDKKESEVAPKGNASLCSSPYFLKGNTGVYQKGSILERKRFSFPPPNMHSTMNSSVLSNKNRPVKSTTQEKEAPSTVVRDRKSSKLMDLKMKKFPLPSSSKELQKTKEPKLDLTNAITKVQLHLNKSLYADIMCSAMTGGELSSDIKKLKEDVPQEEKKIKENFVCMCDRVDPKDIYLKANTPPVLSIHNLSGHQAKTRLQEKKAEKETSKPAIRQARISPSQSPPCSLCVSTGTREESTPMLTRFSISSAGPQKPSDSEGNICIQPVIDDAFLALKNGKQYVLEKAELDGTQRIKITMVPKYQESKTQEQKDGPSMALTKYPSSCLPHPQLDNKELYVTELSLTKPALQRMSNGGETEPTEQIAGDIMNDVTTVVPPKEDIDTKGAADKRGTDTTLHTWKSPLSHKLYRTELHVDIGGHKQKEPEGQGEPQQYKVTRQTYTAKPSPAGVRVGPSKQGDKKSETSPQLPLMTSALADVQTISGTKAMSGNIREEKHGAILKEKAVNMKTGIYGKKAKIPPISQILATKEFVVNMKVLDQSWHRDGSEPQSVLTRTFISTPPAFPFPVDSQNKEEDTAEIAGPQRQLQESPDAQEIAYRDTVGDDSENTVKKAEDRVLPRAAERPRNAEVVSSAQNKSEHLQVKSEGVSSSQGAPIHFTGVSITGSGNKPLACLLGKRAQPEKHEKEHFTTFHSYPSLQATNMGNQKKNEITDTLHHKICSKLLIPLPMKTSKETFVTLDTPVSSKGFPATEGDAHQSRTSSKLSPKSLGSAQFDKLEKDKQNPITISKLHSLKVLTPQKHASYKKIKITKPSNPPNIVDRVIITKKQVMPQSQSVHPTSSSSFISVNFPLQKKLELPHLKQNIQEQKWSQRNVSASLPAYAPLSPQIQKDRPATTHPKTEVSAKDLTMSFPVYPVSEMPGMLGYSSAHSGIKLEQALSKPNNMASYSQDALAVLHRSVTVASTPQNEETFASEIVIRKLKHTCLSKYGEKSPGACGMKDTLTITKGATNCANPDAWDPQPSVVKMQRLPHGKSEENFVSRTNKINITLQTRNRLVPGCDDFRIIKNPDLPMMEQNEKCLVSPSEQPSSVVGESVPRPQAFDAGGCSLPPKQSEQGDEPGRDTSTQEVQPQETVPTASQVKGDERKMLKECLFSIYEAFKTVFEASVGNIIKNKFPSGRLEKVQDCTPDGGKSPLPLEGPDLSSRMYSILQSKPPLKHLTPEEKNKLTKHLASKVIEIKLNMIPEMAKISLQKFNFHSKVGISEDNSWRHYPRHKEMNFMSPGVKEPNLKYSYQKDPLSRKVLIAVSSGKKDTVTRPNSIEKLGNGAPALTASARGHPLTPIFLKYPVEERDKLLMHISRKSLELQSETFSRIVSESYAMVNAQARSKPLPAVKAPKKTNRLLLLFDKTSLREIDLNLQQKYLHAALGSSSNNMAPAPSVLPKPTPKFSTVPSGNKEDDSGRKCTLPIDKGLVQQQPFSFKKQNLHENSVLFKKVQEPSHVHTLGPNLQGDSALRSSGYNLALAPSALPKPTLQLSIAPSCERGDDRGGKCTFPIDKGLVQQQCISFKKENLQENSALFRKEPSHVHTLGPDLQGVKQKDTRGHPELKCHMTPGKNNRCHELFQKENAYKPSDLCTQQKAAGFPESRSARKIADGFTDTGIKTRTSPNPERSLAPKESDSEECVFLETNFYLSQESDDFLFAVEKGIPLEKFFRMKEAAYLKPFYGEGSGVHKVKACKKHSLCTTLSSCDFHRSRRYRSSSKMQSSELVCHRSSSAVEIQSTASSIAFSEEKVSWTMRSKTAYSLTSSSESSFKSHHVKDCHKSHHMHPESKDKKKTKFGLLRKSNVHQDSDYSCVHSEEGHTRKKKVHYCKSERPYESHSNHKSASKHHWEEINFRSERKSNRPFFYACISADSLDSTPKTIRWIIPQETLMKRNFRVPLVAKISNALAISNSPKKLLGRFGKVR